MRVKRGLGRPFLHKRDSGGVIRALEEIVALTSGLEDRVTANCSTRFERLGDLLGKESGVSSQDDHSENYNTHCKVVL